MDLFGNFKDRFCCDAADNKTLFISIFFQLTVFYMNKHEDLDLAILSVLLKGMYLLFAYMLLYIIWEIVL